MNKNRLVIFIAMAIVVVVAIGIFLYIRSLEWTVSITSNLTGAGVYINDEYKGITPLKVKFYDKDKSDWHDYTVYNLRLKKEGYEDSSLYPFTKVDLKMINREGSEYSVSKMEPKTLNITVELTKKEKSLEWTVSITSNPTGAGVYINDEYKGVTPLQVTLYPKAYSLYHLKLKKEGYEDIARGISKADVKDNSIAIELARNEKSTVVWKFNLGFEVVDSSPVISDGKVYIGSYDHYLYCLDVNDGDVVFKYKTGHVIRSTPAVSNGKVYISSFDSYLYCLNANNGNFIWKSKVAIYKSSDWNKHIGISDSSPAISNGKVYIGSNDSYIYCLNAVNGNMLWKYKTGGEIYSTPAIYGSKVYVSSFDSYLYCLNADNGSLLWKYKAERIGYSSPVVSKEKAYIGSNSGLYCFNANNGDVVWKYNIGIDYSSPAVYDGKVYIGSSGPALYCFNADNGSILWKYDRERGIPPDSFFSPVVSNGKIYIGSDDNCIYCFNADNGNFVWKYEVGGPIRTIPAVSDKKVYVSSEIYSGSSYTSYLYCLSADN